MLQIKKILFPTDYSVCAERAFGHAAYLADRYEAELHLLHVVEARNAHPEHLLADSVVSEDDIAEQLHMATGKSGQKPARPDVRIVQAQRHSIPVADAILDYAEEHGIDLITMGTHGRRGTERLLAGSVAEEVVRLSQCPVLTIRAREEPMPRRAVRTILVPIDFSKHSSAALRYARELAAVYDARLEVVHVIEEEILPTVYGLDVAAPPTEQVHKRAAQALRDLVSEETGTAQVETTVMVGHPAAELLTYAKARDVDLLVIATHGRTGLKHLLMGSVAEKLVRRAPCPVLTVKSFGKNLLSQGQASPVQEPKEASY